MKFEINTFNRMTGCITLPIPRGTETALEKLENDIASGKLLTVEIKRKTAKRSLTANAAMWAMLRDCAAVLGTTDQELYILALQKYGKCDYIACKPEAVERVSRPFRLVEDQGTCFIKGQKMRSLKVYPGSSTYDTKEFSVLLDGIISDAKELGVDFISAADRDLLLCQREKGGEN